MKILDKEIINFLKPVYKENKKFFVLLIIIGAISGISSVILPVLLKIETDQLINKSNNFLWIENEPIIIFAIILLIIFIINLFDNLSKSILDIYKTKYKNKIENSIKYNIFLKMKNMEAGRSMNDRFKNFSSKLNNWIFILSNSLLNTPNQIIETIIQILGFSIVFAYFDIKLFFITVCIAILIYITDYIGNIIYEKQNIETQFTDDIKKDFYETLLAFEFSNLAINGSVNQTLEKYKQAIEISQEKEIKISITKLHYSEISQIIQSIWEILIKLFVGYSVFKGTQSVGMVALVIASMWTLQNIIISILNIRTRYINLKLQNDSILLFFEICENVWKINQYNKKLEKIQIKNLEFNYPNFAKYEKKFLELIKNKHNPFWIQLKNKDFEKLTQKIENDTKIEFPKILENINLEFEKWKLYWIVGKNWAWKTTLMQLLAWFYRNYTWEILFNNENIINWKPELLANYISFLTQEPFYLWYYATIFDELTLWVKNIDESKIWNYLEKFWLAEKIQKSDKKLESQIWNDIDFSGWEKQILAFIRLLLQDRPIIIMDEWTNQLDAENEILVMNELLKNKREKIIIFITHRMSTISMVDEIFTIEDKIIKNKWTHNELLSEWKNIYAKFYRNQVLHHKNEQL